MQSEDGPSLAGAATPDSLLSYATGGTASAMYESFPQPATDPADSDPGTAEDEQTPGQHPDPL